MFFCEVIFNLLEVCVGSVCSHSCCETFLEENNTFQHYENYRFFGVSHKKIRRGGVGIFMRDDFNIFFT